MSPHSHALLNNFYQLSSQLLATSQIKRHNYIFNYTLIQKQTIPLRKSSQKNMGNCMESCRNSPQREKSPNGHEEEEEEVEEKGREKGGNMRIKIVLTKEELEWLMFELRNRKGKKFEDVLGEIKRSRERSTEAAAWKPSLDSIVETPENA